MKTTHRIIGSQNTLREVKAALILRGYSLRKYTIEKGVTYSVLYKQLDGTKHTPKGEKILAALVREFQLKLSCLAD